MQNLRNRAVVALGVYLAYLVRRGFDPYSLPQFAKILPNPLRYNLDCWLEALAVESPKNLDKIPVDFEKVSNLFLDKLSNEPPKNSNTLAALIQTHFAEIKLALKRGHSLESLVAILQEIAGEEYSAAITKRRVKAILVDLGLSCTPAKKTTRKPRKPRAPKPAPELPESPAETPPVDPQVSHQGRAILANFKR